MKKLISLLILCLAVGMLSISAGAVDVVETIDINVEVIWDSLNKDGTVPQEVEIQLYREGVYGASRTLTPPDGTECSFTNLPKTDDKGIYEYTYTIEAVMSQTTDAAKYTTEITGSVADGFVVTVTCEIEEVSVSGTVTWNDNDNQDGIRPTELTLDILANGTKTNTATVYAANNWSYTIEDLPKNSAGQPITYTVEVQTVEGYTVTIDGNNITMTAIEPEPTPTPSTEPTPSASSETTSPAKDESNPTTGDASNMLLYLVMLSVSGMLLAGAAFRIRKRKIES